MSVLAQCVHMADRPRDFPPVYFDSVDRKEWKSPLENELIPTVYVHLPELTR